jgi:hypothetical protein
MFYCPKSERKNNLILSEIEIKTKYLYTDGDMDMPRLFSYPLITNRKLKIIKGDFAIPEEDEFLHVERSPHMRPKIRQSLFNELAGVDIGIIKERELTPPQRETAIIEEENDVYMRTNSFNKESMEKMRTSMICKNKLYPIRSKDDSIIKVPENCTLFSNIDSTDDHDLKILIDLINEEPIKTNHWSQVINDKGLAIFKKTVYQINLGRR